MKNSKPYAVVPAALPAAERREAERSEAKRSSAAGKAATEPAAPPNPIPKSSPCQAPEILRRVQAGHPGGGRPGQEQPGAIGALLRREGLYSSHLVTWRQERAAGMLRGLTPQKRGPKSKRHPLDEENQKLRRENERLTEQLRKAEIIIDVQKKHRCASAHPQA